MRSLLGSRLCPRCRAAVVLLLTLLGLPDREVTVFPPTWKQLDMVARETYDLPGLPMQLEYHSQYEGKVGARRSLSTSIMLTW